MHGNPSFPHSQAVIRRHTVFFGLQSSVTAIQRLASHVGYFNLIWVVDSFDSRLLTPMATQKVNRPQASSR